MGAGPGVRPRAMGGRRARLRRAEPPWAGVVPEKRQLPSTAATRFTSPHPVVRFANDHPLPASGARVKSSACSRFTTAHAHVFLARNAKKLSLLPRRDGGEGGQRPDEGALAVAQNV